MWDGKTPLRQLGIQITRLMDTSARQVSLFDAADYEKLSKLDKTVDALREKYGEQALFRAAFLSGDTPNKAGSASTAAPASPSPSTSPSSTCSRI